MPQNPRNQTSGTNIQIEIARRALESSESTACHLWSQLGADRQINSSEEYPPSNDCCQNGCFLESKWQVQGSPEFSCPFFLSVLLPPTAPGFKIRCCKTASLSIVENKPAAGGEKKQEKGIWASPRGHVKTSGVAQSKTQKRGESRFWEEEWSTKIVFRIGAIPQRTSKKHKCEVDRLRF